MGPEYMDAHRIEAIYFLSILNQINAGQKKEINGLGSRSLLAPYSRDKEEQATKPKECDKQVEVFKLVVVLCERYQYLPEQPKLKGESEPGRKGG